MNIRTHPVITSNQQPHKTNYISRFLREISSRAPLVNIVPVPERPQGLSIMMRVKDESDWIVPSVQSISTIADEIIIVDNGSKDGTYQMLEKFVSDSIIPVKIFSKPDLNHCAISNFALCQTRYRWIFRWDGDMVAHTTGNSNISSLKERIFALNQKCYYLIYLQHINLAGDIFHQDPDKLVHIEEYIHTYSGSARYIHPGKFEAIKFPKYYKPLFWYEPYSFHINVKPLRRMLLRYYWEDWMALKDYIEFPTLEAYVNEKIKNDFYTNSWKEAQLKLLYKKVKNYIPYNKKMFGEYPELLGPYLKDPKYLLQYRNGKIAGRDRIKDDN